MVNVAFDSVFLAALLVLFALQQPESLIAGGVLCALYALVKSDFFSIDLYRLIVCLLVLSICLIAVFSLNHDFVPVFYLFSTVSAIYAANRFSSFPLKHVRFCLEIVFWIAVLGIAGGLALHWGAAEPLGELIPGSSTNGLPSYLIVIQIALSISVFLEKNRLPILSALATFVVAIFGLGRGSIIVALLILLFGVFVNFFVVSAGEKNNIFGRLFVVFVFLSVVLGAVYYFDYLAVIQELIEKSKFSAGVLDSHRGDMLADYVGKLDAWSLFLGVDYSGTSINTTYGGNPHNSYIRLHSYYGVFGLLLVALSPFAIFATNKRFICKCVVFMLVLLVLIRAVSEPILFPTLLDFFYALYFLIFWKHAPSRLPYWRSKC